MSHFRPILPLVASLALPLIPSLAYAQATSPTATGCGPTVAIEAVAEPVTTPPPPMPVYEQPPIPAPGYLWTPGYWGNGSDGYYWVPGTWVEPPSPGLLWTPGYWGWFNGVYIFSRGYWGEHVGFYGGVDYGFGYGGNGYEGGRWEHGAFNYNRAVNNFGGVHVTNVYNQTVVHNTTINRTSFNGGTGGINARPTAGELAGVHEARIMRTAAQTQHVQAARTDPALRASANHGNPPIAATARPGEFKQGVVPARGASGAEPGHPGPGAEARPGAVGRPGPGAEVRPGGAEAGHAQPLPGGREPGAARGVTPQVSHPEAMHPGAPATHAPAITHAPEHMAPSRPAMVPHPEARPQMARPEARPQMARPEVRPQMAPRPEARPQIAPRPEARPQMARPEAHPGGRPEDRREH